MGCGASKSADSGKDILASPIPMGHGLKHPEKCTPTPGEPLVSASKVVHVLPVKGVLDSTGETAQSKDAGNLEATEFHDRDHEVFDSFTTNDDATVPVAKLLTRLEDLGLVGNREFVQKYVNSIKNGNITRQEFFTFMKASRSLECQVFLGGSHNPTVWRREVCIPLLEDQQISFYNPQVEEWYEGLVEIENKAKAAAAVLLFVIDNQTRAISSLVEVAEQVTAGRDLVLVVEEIEEGASIAGDLVGKRERLDLNRARSYLADLVMRRCTYADAVVYANLAQATTRAIALVLDAPTRLPVSPRKKKRVTMKNVSGLYFNRQLSAHRELSTDEQFNLLKKRSDDFVLVDELLLSMKTLEIGDTEWLESFIMDYINDLMAGEPDDPDSEYGLNRKDFGAFMEALLEELMDHGETELGCEVFLGGSCNPTVWRKEISIPILEQAGVKYYNPQVDDWHEGLIALESNAKEEASVLLFVMDCQTRAIASLVEVGELITAGRDLVLVVHEIEEGASIVGDPVGQRERGDINRARFYLGDLFLRHATYPDAVVFTSIEEATAKAAEIAKQRRKPRLSGGNSREL